MNSPKLNRAVFRLLKGTAADTEIVLEAGDRVDVGRTDQADIVIQDTRLSRVHFRLDYDSQRAAVKVTDLASRNGILVNQERVEEAWLKEGDRLTAGRQVYELGFAAADQSEFELDEDTEVVANLLFCEHCGASVGPIAVKEGRAKEARGSFLCEDCALVLDPGSKRFLHFELSEKIGAGAAGLVFRAWDLRGHRWVALKVLRPGPKVKARQVLRFVREATLIASLNHPHIVKVYEAQEFEGGHYLSLEYFAGLDLAELLKRERVLSCSEVVLIGRQVAGALAHAGDRGIIHRDVKPANILYDRAAGIAKLSDFGLARQEQTSRRRLTREGEGLGTPTYMPPEQMANAREADHRADVYALGATLYHLTTGLLPINARTYQEFVTELRDHEPPLVTEHRRDAPGPLAALIRRCLCKDPGQRFQSARELERALALLQGELGWT